MQRGKSLPAAGSPPKSIGISRIAALGMNPTAKTVSRRLTPADGPTDDAADTIMPATPVQLRSCPGCRNLVHRGSIVCPICGKSYSQAVAGRILRWGIVVALPLAWLLIVVMHRHH